MQKISLLTGHKLLLEYAKGICEHFKVLARNYDNTKVTQDKIKIKLDEKLVTFYYESNNNDEKLEEPVYLHENSDKMNLFELIVYIIAEKRGHCTNFDLNNMFLKLASTDTDLLEYYDEAEEIADIVTRELPCDELLIGSFI